MRDEKYSDVSRADAYYTDHPDEVWLDCTRQNFFMADGVVHFTNNIYEVITENDGEMEDYWDDHFGEFFAEFIQLVKDNLKACPQANPSYVAPSYKEYYHNRAIAYKHLNYRVDIANDEDVFMSLRVDGEWDDNGEFEDSGASKYSVYAAGGDVPFKNWFIPKFCVGDIFDIDKDSLLKEANDLLHKYVPKEAMITDITYELDSDNPEDWEMPWND